MVEPIGDARARLTRPGAHTVRLRFHPTAAGAARLHVTQFLRSRDLPTGVIDDARSVVSELVANAVQHGRPSPDGFLNLGWELNPRRFVLSVEDGGDQPIRPREAEPDAVDGRGLHIVESLSDSWTVDREAGTTMVCASISIEDGETPPR